MTSPAIGLVGTYWALVELHGDPAVRMNDQQVAHIILQTEGQRLAGSSGCNRIIGTYEVSGDQLHISPLGTTMMMCSENLMRQERGLTAALERVSRYRIEGQVLELLDGERVLARFESRIA